MLSMKRRIASVVSAPSGGASGPFFDSMSRLRGAKLARTAGCARNRSSRFRRRRGLSRWKERGEGADEAPADDDEPREHAEHEALDRRRDAGVAEQLEVSAFHES